MRRYQMSSATRDMLLSHLDGPLPLPRGREFRRERKVIMLAVAHGLLRNEGEKHFLTDLGRRRLREAVDGWAFAIAKLAISGFALPHEPSEVAEAKDLDEVREFAV